MNVFVVDGHSMMRLGIKTFLGAVDGIRIVGEAGNGDDALRLIRAARPDLVILGLNPTGETDGIELCLRLKSTTHSPRILIHTAYNFPEDLASSFLAGADGFLHKSSDGESFLEAVRNTESGKGHWEPGEGIGEPRSVLGATTEGVELTPRERQVLGLMLHRYTYAEIARILHISTNTVKNHVSKILAKFGAQNRRELLSRGPMRNT